MAHVISYHAVMGVMLAAVVLLLALPVTLAGCAAGLAFSALTHGFLDRRWPVVSWMRTTGSAEFAKQAFGRYTVDQAHHAVCLWVSALLVVSV